MTIQEVKKEYKGEYDGVEVYRSTDGTNRFQKSCLEAVRDYSGEETLASNWSFTILTEKEYTKSMLAGTKTRAEFDKDASVLCIIIK